jgi:K+-sensing histidine kinase KdpD
MGPWFWLRPSLAATVSSVLFVGVLALRWSVAGAAESISMLYVLPIALLAMTFGFRVGVGAGVLAVCLFVACMMAKGESLSPLEWLSRVTPLLLIGALVGVATERIREADRAERQTMEVALLQREAAEINDGVLQQMAATKWLLESGHVEEGIELLDATMTTARQLVTRMLGSDSVLPGDPRRSMPTVAESQQ